MNYTLEQLKEMMDENGGDLDLRGTSITSLPEGLTVGGWLYLRGTSITSLPVGLTVGGYLDLSGCTGITNKDHYTVLENGTYVHNRYLYADDILTHVKRKKKIGKYTYFVGKIKGKDVIFDGTNYAHCRSFKEGVVDLEFKAAKDRGSSQYKGLSFESVVKREDAIVMYRIITGACQAGTQQFLDGLSEQKEEYTILEIVELTKGHYGAETFKKFFEEN